MKLTGKVKRATNVPVRDVQFIIIFIIIIIIIRFPTGAGGFIFVTATKATLETTEPPSQRISGALPSGQSGRRGKLTIHLHL
jgi:hypothetical protein